MSHEQLRAPIVAIRYIEQRRNVVVGRVAPPVIVGHGIRERTVRVRRAGCVIVPDIASVSYSLCKILIIL